MKNSVCILGSFNVDMVAKLSRFPESGETMLADHHFMGAGGKGTNQAIAAGNAQATVHFVTKVGQDYFKDFAKDTIAQSHIDSYTLHESITDPTGTALIYVSEEDGENTIAVCSGANVTFTLEEIAQLSPALKEAKVFLTQLETNIDAVIAALELAKKEGCITVLNPAPYSDKILSALSLIDIITPNETEASLLSGIHVTDLTSAKEAAKVIQKQGVKTVIITMGSEGSLLFDEDGYQFIKSFKVKAVDTTGAGDSFNGAFVAAVARGNSIKEACQYATSFASLAVEREGASNMPSHEECLERLKEYLAQ